jgi:hypothetical protein
MRLVLLARTVGWHMQDSSTDLINGTTAAP